MSTEARTIRIMAEHHETLQRLEANSVKEWYGCDACGAWRLLSSPPAEDYWTCGMSAELPLMPVCLGMLVL